MKAGDVVPFSILMPSGESYEERHPEMAKLLRTKILVFIDPNKQGIADQFRMCSLLHVTVVKPIAATKKRVKSA